MSYEGWASIEVDEADLPTIASAAGSGCAEGAIIWADGRGYVADVNQAALDAALAAFEPVASYRGWASIEADMGADLAAVARAAGSACAEGTIIWADGRGYVADVSQGALEGAAAGFDHVAVALDQLKSRMKAEIDAEAERQRLRYITPGTGQAMTYARKVEQARAALAVLDPQAADYPLLAASLGIDGPDIIAVANVILGMDAAWEQIGAAIEAVRLNAKRAIDLAETAEAASAVAASWPG